MRWNGTFSPVRFNRKIFRIAPISRDFRVNAARFLCVPDCVAEAGFEPSILNLANASFCLPSTVVAAVALFA